MRASLWTGDWWACVSLCALRRPELGTGLSFPSSDFISSNTKETLYIQYVREKQQSTSWRSVFVKTTSLEKLHPILMRRFAQQNYSKCCWENSEKVPFSFSVSVSPSPSPPLSSCSCWSGAILECTSNKSMFHGIISYLWIVLTICRSEFLLFLSIQSFKSSRPQQGSTCLQRILFFNACKFPSIAVVQGKLCFHWRIPVDSGLLPSELPFSHWCAPSINQAPRKTCGDPTSYFRHGVSDVTVKMTVFEKIRF